MKNNPMSLAVVCENKQQRAHALEVAQEAGIAFGEWYFEHDGGNILRVDEDGDWLFLDWDGNAKTTLTYADFIAKYGNTEQPHPDPIAELKERMEVVEKTLFGSTSWVQPNLQPNIDIPCIWHQYAAPQPQSFFDHTNRLTVLSAPNVFGNWHRFTDEKGNEFQAPTEIGDKRICIDHVTGLSHECRVVEVDDEEEPTEPQPETIYDGVFWFDQDAANCINDGMMLWYSNVLNKWGVHPTDLAPEPHRLVPVKEFTVGKWYACAGEDLNTPFGYLMYLGDGQFVGWMASETHPIAIHNQQVCDIQLLEVQPA